MSILWQVAIVTCIAMQAEQATVKKLSVGQFVIACEQDNTFSCLESNIPLNCVYTEGAAASPFLVEYYVASALV